MRPDGATPYGKRPGRPLGTRLILAALVLLPLAEILVLIAVGRAIGGWPTLGILVAAAVVGGWVIRHEGRRTWQALRAATESGRMPEREMADAVVVLLGGVLLLIPGFLTDIVGLICVLPVTRSLAGRLFQSAINGRVVMVTRPGGPGAGRPSHGDGHPRPGAARDQVIEGEIIDPSGERGGEGEDASPD